MRRPLAVAVLTVSLLVVVIGCERGVTGKAVGDLHPPLAQVTDDSYGIRAGAAAAPVQLEIYTEPQCTHCAELQADFGDRFAEYIRNGELAITYRPMTFLDTAATDGHSARVVNALFQ